MLSKHTLVIFGARSIMHLWLTFDGWAAVIGLLATWLIIWLSRLLGDIAIRGRGFGRASQKAGNGSMPSEGKVAFSLRKC